MRDLIEKYKSWNLRPIPLKPTEKLPKLKHWQTEDQSEKFEPTDNIGCVLGHYVDIDCDWKEVSGYVGFLVRAKTVFGRASNPASHHILHAPGTKPFKFLCPKSLQARIALPDAHAACIVELRSGLSFTMFPSSVHPSGEKVAFLTSPKGTFDQPPMTVDPFELAIRVGLAAMMVLLEKTWPSTGSRHDAAGAVAGVLRKHAGLGLDACKAIMIPSISDGKERKDRERYIEDTYANPMEKISGWTRLQEVFAFEDDVIRAFKSWLLPPKSSEVGPESSGYNVDHAVIRDGSKVRIGIRSHDPIFEREAWDLLTETDFLLLHHKGASARNWLKSPDRLTYRDGFIFDPSDKEHLHALNLWRGFATKPQEGDWSTIEYHILNVLAGGNIEHHQYILRWLAWLYQNPDKAAEVAIVFRGGRGTGKGILCRAIIRSLGQHGIPMSVSQLQMRSSCSDLTVSPARVT